MRQDTKFITDFYRQIRSDYSAAKASRFKRARNIPVQGAPGDYHLRSESEFYKIMEIARDMDRNDAVVGQVVTRAVQNIIQDGINLDAQTGDVELDKDLVDYWTDWCEDPTQCDIAGELTFNELASIVLRSTFIDGDIVVLPLADSGALQIIEAHRIRTPNNTKRNVILGVLLDDYRRRIQYWIARDDIDIYAPIKYVSDMIQINTWDEEGFRQVFHIYNSKRVSQTRGVSAFAPIMDLTGMFEDLNFAKLVQAQMCSMFCFIEERDAVAPLVKQTQIGAIETVHTGDGFNKRIESISPGTRYTAPPGVHMTGFSPNIPNAEFFPHMKMILTLIGINLGMPLCLTTLDASETNFSGFRGAIDQARLGFRALQQMMITHLYRPVYIWKVRQLMAKNPALQKRRDVIFKHRWNPPKWAYIQPLQDAQADDLRLKSGLTSPRRLHAERGEEWQDIAKEQIEDKAIQISNAILKVQELQQEFPDEVFDWRELCGMESKAININKERQSNE